MHPVTVPPTHTRLSRTATLPRASRLNGPRVAAPLPAARASQPHTRRYTSPSHMRPIGVRLAAARATLPPPLPAARATSPCASAACAMSLRVSQLHGPLRRLLAAALATSPRASPPPLQLHAPRRRPPCSLTHRDAVRLAAARAMSPLPSQQCVTFPCRRHCTYCVTVHLAAMSAGRRSAGPRGDGGTGETRGSDVEEWCRRWVCVARVGVGAASLRAPRVRQRK
jgi:hypothetical protein